MSEQHRSVFLERQTYRRRRLMDAAWLLPIVGVLFWTLPLLWGNAAQGETQTTTSGAMLYIFCVWLGLVGLSAWLSLRLGVALKTPLQGPGMDK